ncbi:hypothetical protein SDC9_212425 [bioreactor metagenome]|uniref:Uncharacterized protein n=1 Tax=bioreactor metagenome TaxID=1076179 RepID=A0A645JPH1_9ZZZZ
MRQHAVDAVAHAAVLLRAAREALVQHTLDKAVARVRHHGGALHAQFTLHRAQNLLHDVAGLGGQVQLGGHGLVALKQLGGGVAGHDPRGCGLRLDQVLDGVQRLMRRAVANIQPWRGLP